MPHQSSSSFNRLIFQLASIGLFCTALPSVVQAQTAWTAGSGQFTTGSNWDNGAPGTTTTATISTSGTLNITLSTSDTIGALLTTGGGFINLGVGSNMLTINGSSSPALSVDNGATLTLTGTTGGGITVQSGQLALGDSSGNSGTLNLNGGTLAVGGANGILAGTGSSIINGGGGTIQVINSSLTTSASLVLASNAYTVINTNGFDAAFNSNVTNSSANNGGFVKAGAGNLTFNGSSNVIASFFVDGGNFNQSAGSFTSNEIGVGSGTGNTGTYTMTGGSLLLLTGTGPAITGNASSSSIRVGDFGGTGTFLQSGGSVAVNGSLNVGNQGGHGTYVLNGGTLSLESGLSTLGRTSGGSPSSGGSTGEFDLSGTGTLILDGTSTFVASNWYNYTGGGAQGTGVINQTGGTITVANTASLILTGQGTGIYNLNGGMLQVGGTSLQGVFGGEGGTYNFNLGGGTIQAYGSDLTTDVSFSLNSPHPSTYSVPSSYSFIDSNGYNATFSGGITAGTAGAGLIVEDSSVGKTGNVIFSGNTSRYIASLLVTGGQATQTTGTTSVAEIAVGTGTGASGTFNLSGGSLSANQIDTAFSGSAASFRVGDYGGTGTFNQTGGTVTIGTLGGNAGALNVGNQGGAGTYNLSGGTLDLELGQFDLGRTTSSSATASSGTLNLSGTGALIANGSFEIIGSDLSAGGGVGNGTINQTGSSTFTVANTATFYLTGNGVGTYNLNGGTLAIGGNSLQGTYTPAGVGGTYNFNLGGGTIQVKDSALVTSVNATLTGSSTSTIDTNGLGATLSGTLSGTGALLKTGSGSLVLSGNGNSYSGGTQVNAGSLIAKNTSGSATGSGTLTVASGAAIGGSGRVAPSSFNISGTVQVGNGVGVDTTSNFTLTNTGSSTFANATLQFNLGSSAGQNNTLNVGLGAIDFNNTIISLTINSAPPTDSLFTLINNGTGTDTYTGLIFGGLDTHGYNRIVGGLGLNLTDGSYLYLNGGTIGVDFAPTPEPNIAVLIVLGLAALVLVRRARLPRAAA